MVTHRSCVGLRTYGTCQVVLAVKLPVYQFFKPAISDLHIHDFKELGLLKMVNPRGEGTPIYGLYRYVPRNRVWFLRFSVLK